MHFHFCIDEIKFLMGLIQQLPDLIIMGKHYLETMYYNTCNKCRLYIATFRNPNKHNEHNEDETQ